MLRAFVLDEALRSAPRFPPSDPDPLPRPDRAPPRREGPVRSVSSMSFDRLGLSPELLRAVADQGYTEPTPVQARGHPARPRRPRPARRRPDRAPARRPPSCCRCSSGCTPRDRAGPRVIRALILTPTRELALQVEESVRTYGAQNPIRSTTIYGGVGFDPQVRAPARRAGDRRRHAGSAARPRRPADDRPVARRDPRPRRGRPDARHGLHPRHPQDPRAPPGAPPEPALLGHVLGRDPAPGRRACSTSRPSCRSRRATRATELVDPGRPSRSTASASASCSAT